MTVRLSAAGKATLRAPGVAALFTQSTLPTPSSWWDAGVPPGGGWTAPIASLADKAGSVPLVPSASAVGSAHLVGALGGAGKKLLANTGFAPVLHPLMDPDHTWSATPAFGPGGAITIDLVFTRPNVRQSGTQAVAAGAWMSAVFLGGVCPLIVIGGVVVVGLTSTGTGDTLAAFPASTNVALQTAIDPRITASVRLRGSHSAGWDVFWNGTQVGTAVASQLGSTPATGTVVRLLGNGTGNSAQCWLHEAITWNRALNASDTSGSEAYLSARWQRRSRAGAVLPWIGQSNSIFTYQNTNALDGLCSGIEYETGMVSVTILAYYLGTDSTKWTIYGGHGLLGAADQSCYLGGSITDTPSTVQFGTGAAGGGPGTALQTFIRSLPAYVQAQVCGLVAYYAENDQSWTWAQRLLFAGMVKRFVQLFRAIPQSGATLTAANSFVAWISAIPFGGTGSMAHRAAIASLVADSTVNAFFWLPNGVDGNPHPSDGVGVAQVYNAGTGVFTGGDPQHLDPVDDIAHSYIGVGLGPDRLPLLLRRHGQPAADQPSLWHGGRQTGGHFHHRLARQRCPAGRHGGGAVMHELNIPEVVAEVRAAFERYDNGLAENDVAVLNDSFWDNDLTLRYGIGENLRSHAEIAAFRAARTPAQHASRARVLENTRITTFGRDFAVANTEYTLVESGRKGRQSQSWVRMPEGWKVVAAHVSMLG